MKQWDHLATALIPGSAGTLDLYRGKDDFTIRLNGRYELMSTRKHGSEDALGRLPCRRLSQPASARILIGGLGMGFTLAAALNEVGPDAQVTVAELIPEVVAWNRGPLGNASGYPLQDPRTQVYDGDVGELLRASQHRFDMIALDVDNGPEGMTTRANDWLYSLKGINTARNALRPKGILAYWSATPDRTFGQQLQRCGLMVDEIKVHAHGKKGARHTIWLAETR